MVRWLLAVNILGRCLTSALGGTITVQEQSFQEILGWGYALAPIDWDGGSMLKSEALVAKLEEKIDAKYIRVFVGAADIYDAAGKQIKESQFETLFRSQFESLRQHDYVLSFLTPPLALKEYFTAAGHVDLKPNRLRSGSESDFAHFMAECAARFERRVGKAPLGIIVRSGEGTTNYSYGCPPTTLQGCVIGEPQYSNLCRELRIILNERDLSRVAILGPETRANSFDETCDEMFLESPVSAAERQKIASMVGYNSRLPIWINARPDPMIVDETERILFVFRQLIDDMKQLRANIWMWPYAFSWEPHPQSLFWGPDFQRSRCAEALEYFWSRVSKGSRVRAITHHSTSAQNAGMDALAITNGGQIIVVIAAGQTAEDFEFPGIKISEFCIFDTGTFAGVPSSNVVSVPARSIVIILGEFENPD